MTTGNGAFVEKDRASRSPSGRALFEGLQEFFLKMFTVISCEGSEQRVGCCKYMVCSRSVEGFEATARSALHEAK